MKEELRYIIANDIKSLGEYQLTDGLSRLLSNGCSLTTSNVRQWLDCGNKNATVDTNSKILALKNSEQLVSSDFVNEDSIIIKPCFIGKGVKICNSVVGPYVSVGDGCQINRSVVSNSIIGCHTIINNAIMDNSMLGSHVKLQGRAIDLSLGDYNEADI